MSKIVLGIETSCDDTSIALIEFGKTEFPRILAHCHFGQEEVLKKWGGVVPEIAARNHLEKITPLLKSAFDQAEIMPENLDLIGVTTHPGLLGPLLTGLNAAKTLSLLYKTPIVPVNHLYAHLEAIFLTEEITYPYLGILVSGGHSMFLLAHSSTHFEVLGSTIDDAAGEAFDKGGKLMNLGYPAGKVIDDLAKESSLDQFEFPIGLKSSADANLSYSGLKTSLRTLIEKDPTVLNKDKIGALCASYQDAIVKAIKLKLRYAYQIALEKTERYELPIVLGGGVACNSYLRSVISRQHESTHIVKPSFCTDNGAMIANYAHRVRETAVPFPATLELDAKNRFVSKRKKA